jgi:hypothetical protein
MMPGWSLLLQVSRLQKNVDDLQHALLKSLHDRQPTVIYAGQGKGGCVVKQQTGALKFHQQQQQLVLAAALAGSCALVPMLNAIALCLKGHLRSAVKRLHLGYIVVACITLLTWIVVHAGGAQRQEWCWWWAVLRCTSAL